MSAKLEDGEILHLTAMGVIIIAFLHNRLAVMCHRSIVSRNDRRQKEMFETVTVDRKAGELPMTETNVCLSHSWKSKPSTIIRNHKRW